MAANHVPLASTVASNRLKSHLIGLRDHLRGVVDEVAIMEQSKDGNDFTELEVAYGSPTGDGHIVHEQTSSVKGYIDAATDLKAALDQAIAILT